MAYKDLSSFPQKYADAWLLFVRDPTFRLPVNSRQHATNIRHTLYAFRRHYRQEVGAGVGSIFDDIELVIKEDPSGSWFITTDSGGWGQEVRERLSKLNQTGESGEST